MGFARGSIAHKDIAGLNELKIQRKMQAFLASNPFSLAEEPVPEIHYKIRFTRSGSESSINCFVEIHTGQQRSWYARGASSRARASFNHALEGLKQILREMERKNTQIMEGEL